MTEPTPDSRLRRMKRSLFVLAALLAASLAANAMLFRLSQKRAAEHAAVRLDPLGLSVLASGDPPVAPGDARVVFFGDSRAQNWPEPAGLAHVQVVNRGIGHQTTAQVLERYERHVSALHPRILVLEVGVNDLKNVVVFPDRASEIVDDCKRNITSIVARARNEGVIVVVATIFPIGPVSLALRPFWSSSVARAVADVNAHVRTLAGEGVVIFETEPLLTDGSGATRSDFSVDHLHLNAEGYAALNAGLAPLLAKLAPDNAQSTQK